MVTVWITDKKRAMDPFSFHCYEDNKKDTFNHRSNNGHVLKNDTWKQTSNVLNPSIYDTGDNDADAQCEKDPNRHLNVTSVSTHLLSTMQTHDTNILCCARKCSLPSLKMHKTGRM